MARHWIKVMVGLSIGAAIALVAAVAQAAPATLVPTAWSGTSFVVEPATLTVGSHTVRVRWERWTSRTAVGSGTLSGILGTVTVQLGSQRFGTFTHLITSGAATFDAELANDGSRAAWVSPRQVRTTGSGLSAYTPGTIHACAHDRAGYVGAHGVTTAGACGLGDDAVRAHTVACGVPAHASARQAVARTRVYDGYALVSEKGYGVLFARGDHYFTFEMQCY